MSHEDLRVRVDEFSYQITSPKSSRFFVRIISSPSDKSKIIISDFLMNDSEGDLALAALSLLSETFALLPGVKVILSDILPSTRSSDTLDKEELVFRHDRFVKMFRDYGRSNRKSGQPIYEVGNAFLEPRDGKYETVIHLRQAAAFH